MPSPRNGPAVPPCGPNILHEPVVAGEDDEWLYRQWPGGRIFRPTDQSISSITSPCRPPSLLPELFDAKIGACSVLCARYRKNGLSRGVRIQPDPAVAAREQFLIGRMLHHLATANGRHGKAELGAVVKHLTRLVRGGAGTSLLPGVPK